MNTLKIGLDTINKNIFFTSDLHLYHTNIIKFCNRPFDNIYQMHNVIKNNWNKVVSSNDIVFILGDISFTQSSRVRDYINSLNGEKILILGNHDKEKYIPNDCFIKIFDFLKINIIINKNTSQTFLLSHRPFLSWEHGINNIHLCGHVHSNSNKHVDLTERCYDVGIDNNNFTPISYMDIINKINNENNSNK